MRLLRDQEIRHADYAPGCARCVYGPIKGAGLGKCEHPVFWERRRDPVRGEWRGQLTSTTSEARSEQGLCGPEGLLFEPYTPLRRVARRIAAMDHDAIVFWGFWTFIAVLFAVLGIAGLVQRIW